MNVLPEGYQLHWYTILKVLGRGGFGITYLARDDNLNTQVAIKEFLPTSLAARGEGLTVAPLSEKEAQTYAWGLARFLEEARTLAQFRHPNIVLVHSVFEANNTAYIVMEYQNGENLESAYRASRLTTEEQLRKLLTSLMDGVEVVHNAGFVHRDIKPANIFLKEHDEPVLLDFGSARQALGAETQTLTAMVSPGYAPFEQYNSSRDSDNQGPWTDIYALGCTIYRGIAGKSHADALILAKDRIEGRNELDRPATEAGRGRFSENFLNAIDVSMRFSPDQRPQSIQAWRQVLDTGFEPGYETSPDDTATLISPPPVPLLPEQSVSDTAPAPPINTATPPPAEQAPSQSPPGASGSKRSAIIAAALAAVVGVGALLMLGGEDDTSPATAAVTTATTDTETTAAAAVKTTATSAAKATPATADSAGCGSDIPEQFCGVAEVLSDLWSSDTSTGKLKLSTPDSDNRFKEGERLVLQYASSLADTNYLYIDYFTLDGSVVHLLHESSEQSNVSSRDESMLLGEEGDIERWDIAPPFGKELITLISSDAPLFKNRSVFEVQKTSGYVKNLQLEIEAARKNGVDVSAQRILIETGK